MDPSLFGIAGQGFLASQARASCLILTQHAWIQSLLKSQARALHFLRPFCVGILEDFSLAYA